MNKTDMENTRILRQVRRTIARHAMFEPRQRVLVAVSGGPDSMALLHVLIRLAPTYQLILGIAHLNHGLRPAAAELEANLVQQEADAHCLPVYIEKVQIDPRAGSLEERARQARYDFFDRVAARQKYHKIALGHQANDNAEAVLMHLMRGSGTRGLSGIPPVRDDRIVRPLIHLQRSEIMDFLNNENIPFALDASNADPRFLRNRIRLQLLPLLQQTYNPSIVSTLARTAAVCLDEERWFHSFLEPLLEKAVIRESQECLQLSVESLNGFDPALQRRLLRQAIDRWRGDLRRLGAEHIESLLGLLQPQRKKGSLNMPGAWIARRQDDRLWFEYHHDTLKEQQSFAYQVSSQDRLPANLSITEAGCQLVFSRVHAPDLEYSGTNHEKVAWFDLNQVSFPLTIRNWLPGDRMTLLGMTGSRKLKKLFNDRGISREQRHRIPVLESFGRILWVAGVRRSHWATISTQTSCALQVRIMSTDRH